MLLVWRTFRVKIMCCQILACDIKLSHKNNLPRKKNMEKRQGDGDTRHAKKKEKRRGVGGNKGSCKLRSVTCIIWPLHDHSNICEKNSCWIVKSGSFLRYCAKRKSIYSLTLLGWTRTPHKNVFLEHILFSLTNFSLFFINGFFELFTVQLMNKERIHEK